MAVESKTSLIINRVTKFHIFVKHLGAGSNAAVMYGSGRVLMAEKKKISAFCRRAAVLHMRQYSIL